MTRLPALALLWTAPHWLWAFSRYAARRFIRDRCLTAAAALSYTTLVSLVPLVAIALTVLSVFPLFAEAREQILGALFRNFVPEVGSEIEWWFRQFADTAVRTTAIGVLALAVTVILLLATIEDQLHSIWRAETSRPWLQRGLAYWAVLTLGPLLLAASFSLPSYFDIAARNTGIDPSAIFNRPAWHGLVKLLPFALETLVLTLLFELIPNCSVRWREAFVGAIVAAALIEGLKAGFTYYIGYFSSYRAVYGALAVIPIFLLWQYVIWSVVLFGAVVAAALPQWQADEHAGKITTGTQRLGLGLALLAELAEQSRQGGVLSTASLVERLRVSTSMVDDHLTMLRQAGFAAATVEGGWVLARALDSFTLIDLYQALHLPLARELSDVEDIPWQGRIAAAMRQIGAAETAAFSLRLGDLLKPPNDQRLPRTS